MSNEIPATVIGTGSISYAFIPRGAGTNNNPLVAPFAAVQ